jgi:hypothetical protein
MAKLQYKVGNLFNNIPENEKVIIAHIVNNEKKMGAGFVIPLMKKFPTLKEQYIKASEKYPKEDLLGKVFYYKEEDNVIVANMFAQDGVGYNTDILHPLRYDALELCMLNTALMVKAKDVKQILAPKLGRGLAGGNWTVIEAMIKEFWVKKDIDVTVYVLDSSELPTN